MPRGQFHPDVAAVAVGSVAAVVEERLALRQLA